jgi:hypothetical protein
MSGTLSPAVLFRRRSGWEAADMGVFLWRANWLPVLFFMGIPLIIIFTIYQIIIKLEFDLTNQIALFFIWWIKPLLDRFCLHVVSVRFFEPRSSPRRLFRGLGKTLRTGLAGDLLWRRLSLARSARMPLLVLERLNGRDYKRRKELLARNGLGFGLPLTLICMGMALALNFGETIFLSSIYDLINGVNSDLFEFINEQSSLIFALSLFNAFLIETLYVCMGFSLYINSRVETEGWDIELLFKTCVEKIKKSRKTLAASALILFLFFAGGRTPAFCNDEQKTVKPELLIPAPAPKEAEKALERVLESPEFGSKKPGKGIQFKQSDRPSNNFNWPNNLNFPGLKEILGIILRFLVVAALVTVLIIAAFYIYRRRGMLFFKREKGKSTVYDPAPEKCRELLQKAEELYKKGRIREAWALCLKAFISVFSELWYCHLPPEATEYEALTLIRKSSDEAAEGGGIGYFETFIRNWIIFAYGGQEPAAGAFEQSLASCRSLLENKGEEA